MTKQNIILGLISNHYGLSRAEILTEKKNRKERALLAFALLSLTSLDEKGISEFLDSSLTSVKTMLKNFAKLYENNPQFKRQVLIFFRNAKDVAGTPRDLAGYPESRDIWDNVV